MFTKTCPKCNRIQSYSRKDALVEALKHNKLCKSCVMLGKKNSLGRTPWNKNMKFPYVKRRPHSEQARKNISTAIQARGGSVWKNKILPEIMKHKISIGTKKAMARPEVKAKYNKAMKDTPWLKVRCDRGQLELLEKWNRLGFNFEPNYQIHTDDVLYYIDGYDKEHNVVLEYDSKYHKKEAQKIKDLERQQRIIEILKPKIFWRYDAVLKQFNNVIGKEK